MVASGTAMKGVNGLSFLKRMLDSGKRNSPVIAKEINKIIKNYRMMVGM